MSQNFNIEPYYDDFEAANGALENNYMRILFRPGYAVQARELTQIQTILQNQLKQLGNHIFQDGSPVVGGHLSIDTAVNYIKLEKQFGGNDIDVEDFLNLTVFNNQVPRTRARVVQTYTGTNERALMIKYLRGTEFSAGESIITAGTNQSANVVPVNHTGLGSTCTINDGVFYVEGFFVKVAQQTIVLEPYSTTPTYRVGLEIDERIVTENQDTALLDPAQESFNYQAPGAHRYKFNLVLAKRSLTSVDDERFFELLRVENGVVTKQVTYPIYSELEKTLARRTYDESGDYVVKPFRANLSANTSPLSGNGDYFIINVEPGKAYVKGFEFETIGTQKIPAQRARTYKESVNYSLSSYYGNRIQLTNYRGGDEGIGFSQNVEEIDIHCVPTDTVVLNGNTHNYFVTKIGSAKIRNIDRAGITDNYHVYISDIEFTPTVALARQDSLYLNEIYLPSFAAARASAYNDATITMLSGAAAGESAIVTGYNGTSKLALLNRDFSSAIQQGDQFSISMPFAVAESFIKPSSTFASAKISANVARASKDAVDSAILEDSTFNKNIFELPNYYVRYDSDQNASLYRRLIRRAQFIANGTYTFGLSTPEEGSFDFGTNAAVVSDAEVNENVIVMPVEGANSYEILDMTVGGRSVYRSTAQQIIINTDSANTTFYADVIVTTKLTDIENTKRIKTLRQANNEITVNDVPGAATSVVGRTDVKLNLANGVAWFMTANVINKIPEVDQSLFVSDVIKIRKIYDSGTLLYPPNTINKIDITDRYVFNSGQTDNYYDHASITLKPGSAPPKGQTAVFFDYYEHTGYGYLAASSYPQETYEAEQIPSYKSSTGRVYNLRDSIDFRPIRNPGTTTAPYKTIELAPTVNIAAGEITVTANVNRLYANVLTPPLLSGSTIRINNEERIVANISNTQSITVTEAFNTTSTNTNIFLVVPNKLFGNVEVYVQRPTDPFVLDFSYYLPRTDLLVLTKDKEFKVLTGVPSSSPIEPTINEDAMPIYRLEIPAYTASLNSVNLEYLENRRYTMKDISSIDERLQILEDLVALKESESDVIDNPPTSPTSPTINKPIYGTLVDDFDDLTIVDTNRDFAASIDNSKLMCHKKIVNLDLSLASSSDVVPPTFDKFESISYTETPAVAQKFATVDSEQQVQTAIIGKFEGFVTLTPESDYYFSTEHQPIITDILGRWFELQTQQRGSNPAFTDSFIGGIGGGNYQDLYYNAGVVLGTLNPIAGINNIFVPPFSSDPTQFEPKTTVSVPIKFDGTSFGSYQGTNWTGASAGGGGGGGSFTNAFTESWLKQAQLIGGGGRLSDDISKNNDV